MRTRILLLGALLAAALVLLPSTAFAGCQVVVSINTNCPNGCSVETDTFYAWPNGEDCYKNMGQTIPCPCGGEVFTASPAGMCDRARQVCRWDVNGRDTILKEGERGLLIAVVYALDCDGELRAMSYDDAVAGQGSSGL
ncbi:MAG: hypothetical protein HYX28_00630 [Candidatus Koribacter versatilis]|uniref:Secreted protein n=1 Tax=Candidatus Korobacter versatilis TaxID=658062 RepID=A0A932EN25_9BACT|nr:hypothetical protein [Candidatus Koribacter versatilis]